MEARRSACGGVAQGSQTIGFDRRVQQGAGNRLGRVSAEAQFALSKWCDEQGLKGPAEAHALAALKLDARVEGAWKRLGFTKHGGAWVNEQALQTHSKKQAHQKTADKYWSTVLNQWKVRLKDPKMRIEAATNLASVSDPRALPAVWRVFGKGTPDDQGSGRGSSLGSTRPPRPGRFALSLFRARPPTPDKPPRTHSIRETSETMLGF